MATVVAVDANKAANGRWSEFEAGVVEGAIAVGIGYRDIADW